MIIMRKKYRRAAQEGTIGGVFAGLILVCLCGVAWPETIVWVLLGGFAGAMSFVQNASLD